MRRPASDKNAAKGYWAGAAGAFVDGAAGALFVEATSGGVDAASFFSEQPVNSPAPTNPKPTANNNVFFIGA
jgi:hypothetical protein